MSIAVKADVFDQIVEQAYNHQQLSMKGPTGKQVGALSVLIELPNPDPMRPHIPVIVKERLVRWEGDTGS